MRWKWEIYNQSLNPRLIIHWHPVIQCWNNCHIELLSEATISVEQGNCFINETWPQRGGGM